MRPITPFSGSLSLLPAIALICPVSAQMLVTYAENPGAYESTLSGTSLYTFNDLTPNTRYENVEWEGVGTFDALYILGADQYGGAGSSGSNYPVQSTSLGGGNAVPVTTFTVSQDLGSVAYFGLWWSAGDGANVLSFYSNEELVAQFTTQTLLNALPAEYFGNPRTGQNGNEAYAFINFYGLQNTTWDTIVLSNAGNSGFESDNYTIREQAWGALEGETGPPPGIPVALVEGENTVTIPEPGTSALALLTLLLGIRRRR